MSSTRPIRAHRKECPRPATRARGGSPVRAPAARIGLVAVRGRRAPGARTRRGQDPAPPGDDEAAEYGGRREKLVPRA